MFNTSPSKCPYRTNCIKITLCSPTICAHDTQPHLSSCARNHIILSKLLDKKENALKNYSHNWWMFWIWPICRFIVQHVNAWFHQKPTSLTFFICTKLLSTLFSNLLIVMRHLKVWNPMWYMKTYSVQYWKRHLQSWLLSITTTWVFFHTPKHNGKVT